MADVGMRPRFSLSTPCDVETLVTVLHEGAENASPPLEGVFGAEHCVLSLPEERRSFWSPELDLTFESLDAGGVEPSRGVRVRCLFAPRPSVWTGFAFVYAMLAAIALASGLYGIAQLGLGESPSGLGVAMVASLALGGLYVASLIGQGLAAEQMYELRAHLDGALARAEERARQTPRTSLDGARL